jgi:hypothetical protein
MTEFPSDTAGERPAGEEPAAQSEAQSALTGFAAELAAAMKEVGEQAGPDEFDSRAILRRTARRRTSQVLGTAAAALAVVAGATAFAVQRGPTVAVAAQPSPVAVQSGPSTSSGPALGKTDPLVLSGHIGTQAAGGSPLGSTVYDVSAQETGAGGVTSLRMWRVQTTYSSGGTKYTLNVDMLGITSTAVFKKDAFGMDNDVIGTVNGHPAYSNRGLHSVDFWSGPLGYARVYTDDSPLGNVSMAEPNVTMLLGAAKAFVASPSDLPLPLRIAGVNIGEVWSAGFDQAPGSSSWTMRIMLTIDGRSYEIDANPGPAITPSATASATTGGEYPAMEMVNGIGISVSTYTGTHGSASAPTVSQLLARITSLGTDPSNWTTDVLAN